MNSFNEKIDNEIRKTLEVPDAIERAKGNPFLITRIKSRLEEKNEGASYFGQQIPVMVMVVVLLFVNSLVLFQTLPTNNASTENVLTESLFPLDEETNWIDYLN